MRFLAFDTSSTTGIVAVVDSDGSPAVTLASEQWTRDISHGELLTPAIESVLQKSQLKLGDLEALVVGIGPGSFTGSRISVNVARALSFAQNLPIYQFTTSELIAAAIPKRSTELAVLIDAQRNAVYLSTYVWQDDLGWCERMPLELIPLGKVSAALESQAPNRYLVVGDGYELDHGLDRPMIEPLLVREPGLCDQVSLASFTQLGLHGRLQNRKASTWKNLQALYLRSSSAEEKLREGLGTKSSGLKR